MTLAPTVRVNSYSLLTVKCVCYTVNGLINTAGISKYISGKATCIQKSRPQKDSSTERMPSPRGAADKLLGAARHSGQHWRGRRKRCPSCRSSAGGTGGQLGLSDRKREADEATGAGAAGPAPQACSTVFLGHISHSIVLSDPGTPA